MEITSLVKKKITDVNLEFDPDEEHEDMYELSFWSGDECVLSMYLDETEASAIAVAFEEAFPTEG
jgi:hypothetical protein